MSPVQTNAHSVIGFFFLGGILIALARDSFQADKELARRTIFRLGGSACPPPTVPCAGSDRSVSRRQAGLVSD
jgi:hypothetical protein